MIESTNSVKLNNPSIQGSTVSNNNNPSPQNEPDNGTPATQIVTTEVSESTQKAVANAQVSYALAGIMIKSSKDANVKKTAEEYLNKLSPELRAQLEADIGALMAEFEPGVVNGLKLFEEELGAKFTNLPEDEQLALAAAMFANNDEDE